MIKSTTSSPVSGFGPSRRAVLVGLGAAGLSAPWISQARAAEFEWKFGHGFPASHPVHVHAAAAATTIREATGGRVKIDVFPNSQLGGDSDLLSQVRSGGVDFFSTGGLIFATVVPIAAISGTGFAFTDAGAVWTAMDGDLGAYIRTGFEKAGLHAFDRIWNNGFRQITTSSKPITGPQDLVNFKIRVPVSQVYISLFKALGASPTSINLAEVYTALQTRVVDGQENPLVVAESAKFYEVQKYCSLTNHVWDGSWIVMNAKTWRSAPDDVKAAVAKGFDDASLRQREAVTKTNKDLEESLKSKGVTFNATQPEPFREALRKAGFYADWKNRHGEEAWSLLEKSVGRLA
ncbi:TRAP transporter substrate-binding protein [Siculibacillus lacustris]|uniref:TRAP transporter substrate-binding protein n=1 Tax=Siculibacillus lacustris TaxID=1549641 RepID=A0A4Q9VWG1_9HYPH|nr:TRAP transporter substrate-binding protein [Siculibacillus lacustris]TBW39445.1 TRAP transporter substrate-binding protein [Siculibacillus lacustris]